MPTLENEKIRSAVSDALKEIFDGANRRQNEDDLRGPDPKVAEALESVRQSLRLNQNDAANLKRDLVGFFSVLRAIGYFDLLAKSGRNEKSQLLRVLRAVLSRNQADIGHWMANDAEAVLYEAIATELSKRPVSQLQNARIRHDLPQLTLLWRAFAEGAYMGKSRAGWTGITPQNKAGVQHWIYREEPTQSLAEHWTSYDAYVDHVYQRLEKLLDPVDIVFADLIMLNDLAERKLILELRDEDETLQAFFGKAVNGTQQLGKAARLGSLVTVNYHVPAADPIACEGIKQAAVRDASALQNYSDRLCAAIAALSQTDSCVSELFSFATVDPKGSKSTRKFDDQSFDPSPVWLSEIKTRAVAPKTKGYQPLMSADLFKARWGKSARQPGSAPARAAFSDTFLVNLGPSHPVAPMQLAAGPHATYSAFAYFANCSSSVSGLVERSSISSRHANGPQRFQEINAVPGKVLSLEEDALVIGRGGEYLRMPMADALETRAAALFNFMWQFVPGLSLCLDQMMTAIAREGPYQRRWFDPCWPVESVLFHSDDYTKRLQIGERPTALEPANAPERNTRLSCFGGYAFAISAQTVATRKSIKLVETLRGELQTATKEKKQKNEEGAIRYGLCVADGDQAAAIQHSAVRPHVPFWPLVDSVISETLRLYFAAIVVLRCLRIDTMLVTAIANQGAPDAKEFKSFWDPIERDLGGGRVNAFIDYLVTQNGSVGSQELFAECRHVINADAVRVVLSELELRMAAQFKGRGEEAHRLSETSLRSLAVDSDYIAGIIQSSESLPELAQQFVQTIVQKLHQIAASRRWKLVHAS